MRRPPHARGTRRGLFAGAVIAHLADFRLEPRNFNTATRVPERVNGGGSLSPAKCAPPSGCRPNFNPQLVNAPSRASFTGRHLRLVGPIRPQVTGGPCVQCHTPRQPAIEAPPPVVVLALRLALQS